MKGYYDIDEFIANIQVDLGFATSAMSPVIKRWIYEGYLEIGGLRMILYKKKLEIKNLKITKPDDFVGVDSIYLTKEASGSACIKPTYDKSVWCCRSTSKCDQRYLVNQTRDSFCFSSNITPDFTHVWLSYYACPVDENGNPLIPIDIREAILAFVTYRFQKRKRLQHQGGPRGTNPVTALDLNQDMKHWQIERRKARGILNSPNIQELEEIGEDMMYQITNVYPKKLNKYIGSFFSNYT